MRAHEFITEGGMHKISDDQKAAMQNVSTFPSLNLGTGSAYMNYRFGLAMAGAPDYPTKADNFIAGDPLLSTYTEAEMEIINMAAQQVGAGKPQKWSNNRSQEMNNVHKTSPIAKPKKNRYGV
jgi:hypothetical protein